MANRTRKQGAVASSAHWKLIEDITRKLVQLIPYLSLPPREAAQHLQRLIAKLSVTAKPAEIQQGVEGATFEELFQGPPGIMQTWFRDLDFLDDLGRPRSLPFKHPSPSFTDLIRRSGSGVPARQELKRLLSSGAVTMAEGGLIAPVSFSVVFGGASSRAAVGLYAVDNLLTSVQANLHNSTPHGVLQREAVCLRFDPKQLPRANRYLRQQCLAVLEQMDDWLHQHKVSPKARSKKAATVIVGTYVTVRGPGGKSSARPAVPSPAKSRQR